MQIILPFTLSWSGKNWWPFHSELSLLSILNFIFFNGHRNTEINRIVVFSCTRGKTPPPGHREGKGVSFISTCDKGRTGFGYLRPQFQGQQCETQVIRNGSTPKLYTKSAKKNQYIKKKRINILKNIGKEIRT